MKPGQEITLRSKRKASFIWVISGNFQISSLLNSVAMNSLYKTILCRSHLGSGWLKTFPKNFFTWLSRSSAWLTRCFCSGYLNSGYGTPAACEMLHFLTYSTRSDSDRDGDTCIVVSWLLDLISCLASHHLFLWRMNNGVLCEIAFGHFWWNQYCIILQKNCNSWS